MERQLEQMRARIIRDARDQLLREAEERDDHVTLLHRLPQLCRDTAIAYYLCRQRHAQP